MNLLFQDRQTFARYLAVTMHLDDDRLVANDFEDTFWLCSGWAIARRITPAMQAQMDTLSGADVAGLLASSTKKARRSRSLGVAARPRQRRFCVVDAVARRGRSSHHQPTHDAPAPLAADHGLTANCSGPASRLVRLAHPPAIISFSTYLFRAIEEPQGTKASASK